MSGIMRIGEIISVTILFISAITIDFISPAAISGVFIFYWIFVSIGGFALIFYFLSYKVKMKVAAMTSPGHSKQVIKWIAIYLLMVHGASVWLIGTLFAITVVFHAIIPEIRNNRKFMINKF